MTNQTNKINLEVMNISSAIRVIPNDIPDMERNLLCATFLEAVIRFYEDPVNAQAFEKWRAEKGGDTYEPKDS